MKKLLVSVVEDDQFCRESMGRLMRSLSYTVEAFSSAADFDDVSFQSPFSADLYIVQRPARSGGMGRSQRGPFERRG
jgi:FixJ family two-component response regulator